MNRKKLRNVLNIVLLVVLHRYIICKIVFHWHYSESYLNSKNFEQLLKTV
jgi:hypothetical protein